jgi:hypothetical protein
VGCVGRLAHEAVSRRPPISLDTIVARTHMYTYDAIVWALSIVQGHFLSPVPNPNVTIRKCSSAVGPERLLTTLGSTVGCVWGDCRPAAVRQNVGASAPTTCPPPLRQLR